MCWITQLIVNTLTITFYTFEIISHFKIMLHGCVSLYTICVSQQKQVNIGCVCVCVWGGGVRLTDLSSGYEVMLPLNIFKTKFPSLLITFIMTTNAKYKNS